MAVEADALLRFLSIQPWTFVGATPFGAGYQFSAVKLACHGLVLTEYRDIPG